MKSRNFKVSSCLGLEAMMSRLGLGRFGPRSSSAPYVFFKIQNSEIASLFFLRRPCRAASDCVIAYIQYIFGTVQKIGSSEGSRLTRFCRKFTPNRINGKMI